MATIQITFTDKSTKLVQTVDPINEEESCWMTWVSVATLIDIYGPEAVSDHSSVNIPTLTVKGVEYVTNDTAFIDEDGYALWAVCELPLMKKVLQVA